MKIHEYAESIIDTVREPLIMLNQDLRVVTVSRSFYEFFKVMKTADSAMYQAKQAGRNQYRLYNEAQRCDTLASPH